MNRRDVNKLLVAAPLFPGLLTKADRSKSLLEELGLDSYNDFFVRDDILYLKGLQGNREVVIGMDQDGNVAMEAVPFVDLSNEPPQYVACKAFLPFMGSWLTYKQQKQSHPDPVYLFPKEKVTQDLFTIESINCAGGRVFLDMPVLGGLRGLGGFGASYRGLFRIWRFNTYILCWPAADTPHVWPQVDYVKNKTYSREKLFQANAVLPQASA